MTAVMVDASVLLAAFDQDDKEYAASAAVLASPDLSLATLDLARYEAANVVVRAWKSPRDLQPLLAAVDRIGEDGGVVQSSTEMLAAAASCARRHDLSVYDATYVVAAQSRDEVLLSCDVRDLVSKGLAVLPSQLLGEVRAT